MGGNHIMHKTRFWVILLTAAAAFLALISWRLLSARTAAAVVQVEQDGRVLREIDLAAVVEEYRFTVDWPGGGSNTLLVQPGRICVEEADCPDGVCVRQGWLTDQTAPIVCLPHRLVIRALPSGGTLSDAVSQ